MEVHKVIILEDVDKKKRVPKVEEFNRICRICLADFSSSKLTSKTPQDVEEKIMIKSLLESYTPIKIPEYNDNLPKSICENCIQFLIEIHIFRSRCLVNTDLLNRIWKKSLLNDPADTEIHESVDTEETESSSINVEVQNIINKINDELIGIYRCKSCPEVFENSKDLTQHRLKARHSVTPSCPCPYCGRKFNKSALEKHIRTHTKEKPFICEECGTAFTVKNNLLRHMRSHVKEKDYPCKLCGKKYTRAENLATHLRTHPYNEEKDEHTDDAADYFKCFVCEKCFETNEDLKVHMRGHGRSYLCSECGKACAGNAHLVAHMRGHSGERPFTCTTCNKAFATAAILRTHQITHSDEKPFECEYCHKRFKLKGTLTVHKTSHTDVGSFRCLVCEKTFVRKQLLDVHMRVHTGNKEYECKVCAKRFRQLTHLTYHRRIHSGEKPYACEYCGKTFAVKGNLTVHKRMHTGERPYECRICQKGFMDSSSRKKHEEKQHGQVEGFLSNDKMMQEEDDETIELQEHAEDLIPNID